MAVAPGWQAELRARGYRLTPQRQLVLEAVAELGHATPEDIAAKVKSTAGGVNISTVYRTLELLENLGLVRHAHLGHGAPVYHAADVQAHVHLVCARCDRVQELPIDVLAGLVEQVSAAADFVVDVGHVTLAGTCADCAGQEMA